MTGIYQLKWDGLQLIGTRNRRFSIPMKRTKLIQAVAVPFAPSSAEDADHRKQLAESFGFKKIGESLPDDVTLRDVVDTLPKKVASKNFTSSHCSPFFYLNLILPCNVLRVTMWHLANSTKKSRESAYCYLEHVCHVIITLKNYKMFVIYEKGLQSIDSLLHLRVRLRVLRTLKVFAN